MNQNERKQVRVSPTIHKEMFRVKAETGKDLDQLVAEAWEFYKRENLLPDKEQIVNGDKGLLIPENSPLEKPSNIPHNRDLRIVISEMKSLAAEAEALLEDPQVGIAGDLHQQSADADAERMSRSLEKARANTKESRQIAESLRRNREDLQRRSRDPKRATG